MVRCLSSATRKKVTIMIPQDENRGKLCPSAVKDCISAEAIALINFKLHMVGLLDTPPQWSSSAIIGAPQSLSALLNAHWRTSIPSAPQSRLVLWYFIQRSILPFLSALFFLDGRSSIPSSTSIRCASISFQTLYIPTRLALLSMNGLLRCVGAPQSPSALLGLDLRPSISFCIRTPLDHLTPHQALLLSWWRTSSSPEFIILPFKLHFDSLLANLNSNPFRYHKSSHTTLEFNFTHSPGPNHLAI